MPQLSVIVPAYNEERTIKQILEKIHSVAIDKEIIVIENGSTDNTGKILHDIPYTNMKVIHHVTNRGKGGAVLTGIAHATGDFVIIQDADLEYDPNDYFGLLKALQEGKGDLILGARFKQGHQGLWIHRIGNRFLTWLLNTLFFCRLNDYATCYKLATRETFAALQLKATGFDLDVEIVCNALKKRMRVVEIPVAYIPRTYQAGKKIRWKDGIWAIFYIIKYRVVQ